MSENAPLSAEEIEILTWGVAFAGARKETKPVRLYHLMNTARNAINDVLEEESHSERMEQRKRNSFQSVEVLVGMLVSGHQIQRLRMDATGRRDGRFETGISYPLT